VTRRRIKCLCWEVSGPIGYFALNISELVYACNSVYACIWFNVWRIWHNNEEVLLLGLR
jgi:hypothetical protein